MVRVGSWELGGVSGRYTLQVLLVNMILLERCQAQRTTQMHIYERWESALP